MAAKTASEAPDEEDALDKLQRERDGGIAEKAINQRELLVRFVNLPFSKQTRIMREMGMLDASYHTLSDVDRWSKFFKEARRLGRLVDLSNRLSAEEADMET